MCVHVYESMWHSSRKDCRSHSVTQKGRGASAMWIPVEEISGFLVRLWNICSSGMVFVNILKNPGTSQEVQLKDLF